MILSLLHGLSKFRSSTAGQSRKESMVTRNFPDLQFIQVAWVVKDLAAAEKLFRESMGISNFSKPDIIRLADFDGTHYGEPSHAESLVSQA